MDLTEDSKVSTPLRDEERVEPGELLEESWFFGNLLDRKTRMSRCFSDPCPSSKLKQDMFVGKSYEETYTSIKKLTQEGGGGGGGFARPGLIKAPSMPACMPREVSSPNNYQAKESDVPRGGSKSSLLTSSRNINYLHRAPSLPLSVDRDEDEESDYSLGRLIRQASLGQTKMLPPRRTTSKIMVPSTVPRYRPRRKPELESIKTEGSEERRRQHVLNRTKSKKSLADLESEEVQGFKELGFNFDKKELNSNVVNILPGLQEKKRDDADEHKVRRPYLSEAWLARSSSTPPVLNNVGNKSAEDMKAQIKFWARAVASNVRQEC